MPSVTQNQKFIKCITVQLFQQRPQASHRGNKSQRAQAEVAVAVKMGQVVCSADRLLSEVSMGQCYPVLPQMGEALE